MEKGNNLWCIKRKERYVTVLAPIGTVINSGTREEFTNTKKVQSGRVKWYAML